MDGSNLKTHEAMEKITRKIPKEGRSHEFYILRTEWHEDNLSLTVIDNDVAWAGEMDTSKVQEVCDTMRKEKDEYIVELKRALSEDEKDFSFSIENESFLVKKVDHKSDIKVKFCIIQLRQISNISTYFLLLSEVLSQEKKNRSTIKDLTQEVQYLNSEREDLMGRLQQFVSEKASMETILYSKFCEVLNTKKEKIISLELQAGANRNLLQTQLAVPPTQNTNANEKNVQRSAVAVQHTAQNSCVLKQKCTITDGSKVQSNLEPKEDDLSSNDQEDTSTTISINKQNSNHYDSVTDVDTDDEISDCDTVGNVKPVLSRSFDLPEKNSTRVLPKRVCSSSSNSILPKRVRNNSNIKSSIKNKDVKSSEKFIDQSKSSNSNKEFCDEFNSQSLLED